MSNLIKEARLIFLEQNDETNSYKWWNAQLYDDGKVKIQYARVGAEHPQSGEWDGGEKYFNKKVSEKLKKGYVEQKTIGSATASSTPSVTVKNSDLLEIAKKQIIKTSNPILERLIKRLVDSNIHKITSSTQITYNSTTGLFSTPLGLIDKYGIDEARLILADISTLVNQNRFNNEFNKLVFKYLTIIPQSLGMKKIQPITIIPNNEALQEQLDILDSLSASYQALQPTSQSLPQNQTTEEVFKVNLDILNDNNERSRLNNFFEKSKKSMHGYDNIRVKEMYKVDINTMTSNFLHTDPNIVETFHGSSMANVLSILKSGLKINPPSTAAIAGKLFDNGIYGSVNSTKSLGYCLNKWSQGGVGDAAFLFICSFAMGKTYTTTAYGCKRPTNYDSIWAKASSNRLKNDELIVYSENRVKINYLLECK